MTAALLGPDTRCRTAGSLRNPGLLVKTRIFAGEAGRQTPAENAGHGGEGGRADLVDNNLEQDAPGRDQLGADGAHAEEPAGAPPTGDEDPGRGARPDRRREGPLGRRHDRPASEGARAEPVGRVMEPSPVHRAPRAGRSLSPREKRGRSRIERVGSGAQNEEASRRRERTRERRSEGRPEERQGRSERGKDHGGKKSGKRKEKAPAE